MKHRLLSALLALVLTVPALLAAQPDHPFLHPLFSDHAVLQRGIKVPVWGWTTPGTKVTVEFAGQTRTATAGKDGKWLVRLKAMAASAEPRTLKVSTDSGQSASADDVLVGDVWLCSGQSNMEMGMVACNATNDIAQANFPTIRLLTVPHLIARDPVDSVQVSWVHCSPEALKHGLFGGFSAAAFYFGRELHDQLDIPIGLIHSSWGGTVAEAWTSLEGLEPVESLKGRVEQFLASKAAAGSSGRSYNELLEDWAKQHDPGTAKRWNDPKTELSDWRTVTMPQYFEKAGLPDYDGIVWFRHEFDLPADWAGKKAVLNLGAIDDMDTTWINGTKVGQTSRHDQNRSYQVPEGVLKAGQNTIAIRVLDTGGDGGFSGTAAQLFIKSAEGQASPVSLAGSWKMHDSIALNKLPAPPQSPDPNNPNVCTVLYNGMIAPLLPYGIKGAIWYQGESNADRAYQYRKLLPAMIADWRRRFDVGDFPFEIVQLANFMATYSQPRDNEWAELREAQALTAKQVPHCGLAVAIDIGEANDIHPKNKRDIGKRLALWALAKNYGKKVEYSGPWYKSMRISGDKVRLSFAHVDGGLVAKGGALNGFAVAGEDRKFSWADAVIEGDKVVVSSPQVPKPVAVRYAWDINPECNLYNQAGLPAVPFRTDNWPGLTQDRK